MTPWYATNARRLLERRQQGDAPAGPVVVSLVGGEYPAYTLHARQDMPQDRMDWRMLVDLQVWVWAGVSAPMDWIVGTVGRIAQARPKELLVRFQHGDVVHDVEVGAGEHRAAVLEFPAVHEFIWLPLNLGGTCLGARIRGALRAKHKDWTKL
jgi:hypothetical protein